MSLIRELYTNPAHIIKDCMELRRLTDLQYLCLDFGKEGLQTQHPVCQRLFPNLASSKLSDLVIDMIPRIDRTLLSFISTTFPRLKTLKISVTGRLTVDRECVCWCCFEDILECCMHSPIPDSYGDANLLAVSSIPSISFHTCLFVLTTTLRNLTQLRCNLSINLPN